MNLNVPKNKWLKKKEQEEKKLELRKKLEDSIEKCWEINKDYFLVYRREESFSKWVHSSIENDEQKYEFYKLYYSWFIIPYNCIPEFMDERREIVEELVDIYFS